MTDPILKIQNVVKKFGEKTILKGLNFDIRKGEIFGLIGASGSGKTTLLSIMIGFVRPEQGDVLFRFEHLLDFEKAMTFRSVFKKQEIVKKMYGFAAQVPSFYENLKVRENLEFFGSLYNLSKDALKTNVETLLNLMDLKNSEDLLAKNLSGGMERRLDIACALIHDPKVLLLDEPTADLDPVLREHIWNLVKKINKKGTTIIIASHHLNELENLCSRIAILKKGKIIDVASPEAIKNKYAKIQEIHLESYPGNYEKIINQLKKKKLIDCERKGSELIIRSNKPQKTFQELFPILAKLKEEITDLKVGKPSLDEVFISISEEKEEKKEKKEHETP
ncbi:MAG: ABC transporter ATP-binding protein [Nanoarchaeota archaeon]|nr:ABC transporter ATP-binding protein [Nanoarchaeota archaeon]MBU1031208.1 ABC transporter ATP-binding protein [Nanoarchaeota archaeon]MBU1850330.1 ABC transporter ATP-binding protein [Nanoarchaeota archaeon]